MFDTLIYLLDTVKLFEKYAVGTHLNHVYILIEHAVFVNPVIADTPHKPDLFRSPFDRLHQVGVFDPNGVDIFAALVLHGRHENRQRDTGHQQFSRCLGMRDDFICFRSVVADIEGPLHTAG